ncbi:hypothetical protein ACO0QE_003166 [Hanseniaspora vineae]
MDFRSKKQPTSKLHNVQKINGLDEKVENPTIRIAVLGGKGTGKSSFISRLTVNLVPEVHYPTLKQNNWLLQFVPEKSRISRCLLDEHWHERMGHDIHNVNLVDGCIYPSPNLSQHLLLSKNLFQNATNDFIRFRQNYVTASSGSNSLSAQTSSSSVKASSSNNNKYINTLPESAYTELNVLKDKQENIYYKYVTGKVALAENNAAKHNYYLYQYDNSDSTNAYNSSHDFEDDDDEDNLYADGDKIRVTEKDLLELKKISTLPLSSISTEDETLTQRNNSNNTLSAIPSQGNPTFSVAGHDTLTVLKTIKEQNQMKLPLMYKPPAISPMLIDIIDTPPFDPEMVVPFLEVSLFRNIGSDYLHNLAKDPRRPVSTRSMLTASGANELNGNVDCYILMYSCYPETIEPPQYDDLEDSIGAHGSTVSANTKKSSTSNENDDQIMLLENIRESIEEAWEEFHTYKQNWEEGQEGDVYSVMYNLKKLWSSKPKKTRRSSSTTSEKGQNTNNKPLKKKKFRSFDDPLAPPPFIIVATHTACELTSPVLLQRGKDLATEWGCSFVAIDNYVDYNVEEALSLAIREVVEKKKLNKSKMK